ncbi:MAG: sigma-54-dependent Fis family transcriptional regulator [Verrucomicrobia bacterium Tous-C9LFEB]|nr:MAG: sigma-54-dependent Fis family transcriptional regulator [Verrucomicrobia bacterium Tous-C9LFEB]
MTDFTPCNGSGCSHFDNAPLPTALEGIAPNACRIIRDLTLLFEISQIVAGNLEVRETIRPILKQLCTSIGAQRGMINIINRETSELPIDESFGLTPEEKSQSHSKLGEGLIGMVGETGKPIVVSNISQSEHFRDRTPTPAEFNESDVSAAFFCVPIRTAQAIHGTLSIERIMRRGEPTDDDLRLLTLIASVIAQAVSVRQSTQERLQVLRRENERLQEQIKNQFKPINMIGSSSAMRSVYLHIEQVSTSATTTVLIRGESGVGKELVASAIHNASNRKGKAFVKVNCAALPDSIIESELFGHEKGAFTGAIAMRKGRFEIANGGTIFLDEIGDISPATQVKLLRVLQEKEFERVGSQTPIRCDVRVIAATSRNLEQLIEEQKFRMDLYYRLNVFPIYVPPLRERKSDILQLADHFVEKDSLAAGKNIRRISTAAIDLLMSYHWPGNVRELENCIERAVLLCNDDAIHAHHLPPTLQAAEPASIQSRSTLDSALNSLEREMLIDALKATQGNMSQAARMLGITERIMGLRVKKHVIEPGIFRQATPAVA